MFVLSLITITAPMAQSSVNCACPAKDPLANPSCGPEPAKMFNDDRSLKCVLNDVVNQATLGTYQKIIDAQNQSTLTSKSFSDIGNYISCYRRNDEQFCHFKSTLSSHIMLAAKSSGLSPAVQACEFLQESQFRADPPHGTEHPSLGYVQFEPDTIKVMNRIVAQPHPEKWKKELSDIEQKMNDPKMNYSAADVNYLDSKRLTLKAQIEARRAWDNYWAGSANTPKSITENSVKCPQIAFAIAGAKQLYDLNLMRSFTNNTDANGEMKIADMNAVDSGIFLAGAYNAGIGGFNKHCKNTSDLKSCMAQFKNHKNGTESETHKHMRSIQTCALKNDWSPMNNDKPKNCAESKCM